MKQDALDEELVGAARGGDKEAIGTLLTRHRPLLLVLCRRALGDDGLAEDAAQEAALQALLNLDRLRQPDRFGPWLAGIGLNVCHRWRRQRLREAWSWEAMLGGGLVPEPADAAPGPEDQAEAAELREWVKQVVAALPPGQRVAVALHYLAGLTQTETAALLGIELGAVKTRLHKARVSLRGRLATDHPYGVGREKGRTMVEMRLIDVRRRAKAEGELPRHIVILEEVNGSRRLTIWISEFEATALALQLEAVSQPRPLTYAFAAGLLQAAGGRLREVRIERLDGEVFYATAVVEGPTGAQEVDARPSDVLNLALLLSVPIRVDEAVIAAAGGVRSAEEWTALEASSEGPRVIATEVMAEWAKAVSGKAEED